MTLSTRSTKYTSLQNKIISTLVAVLSDASCFFLAILSFSNCSRRLESRDNNRITTVGRRHLSKVTGSIQARGFVYWRKFFNQKDRRLLPCSTHDLLARSPQAPDDHQVATKPDPIEERFKKRTMDFLIRFTIHSSCIKSRLQSMKPRPDAIQILAAPITSMGFSPDGTSLAVAKLVTFLHCMSKHL